jgi:hypothetical protein
MNCAQDQHTRRMLNPLRIILFHYLSHPPTTPKVVNSIVRLHKRMRQRLLLILQVHKPSLIRHQRPRQYTSFTEEKETQCRDMCVGVGRKRLVISINASMQKRYQTSKENHFPYARNFQIRQNIRSDTGSLHVNTNASSYKSIREKNQTGSTVCNGT